MRPRMTLLLLPVLALVLAQDTAAQESDSAQRDPAIALGFAFLCPGCGHLYSGETTKGAVIAAISIGSVATGLGIQLSRQASLIPRECPWTIEATTCGFSNAGWSMTPLLVGGAVGLAAYLYGLMDAGSSARRMNEQSRTGLGPLEVKPELASDGSVRAGIGMRIATRW